MNYQSFFTFDELVAAVSSRSRVQAPVTLTKNHFNNAFQAVYGAVEFAVSDSGHVEHELNGIDFQGEDVAGISCLYIDEKLQVPHFIEEMLKTFAAVVHVARGVLSGASDAAEGQASEPQAEVVVIHVHTAESIFVAFCPIDSGKRTIVRAELMPVTQSVQGQLARAMPTRH